MKELHIGDIGFLASLNNFVLQHRLLRGPCFLFWLADQGRRKLQNSLAQQIEKAESSITKWGDSLSTDQV